MANFWYLSLALGFATIAAAFLSCIAWLCGCWVRITIINLNQYGLVRKLRLHFEKIVNFRNTKVVFRCKIKYNPKRADIVNREPYIRTMMKKIKNNQTNITQCVISRILVNNIVIRLA